MVTRGFVNPPSTPGYVSQRPDILAFTPDSIRGGANRFPCGGHIQVESLDHELIMLPESSPTYRVEKYHLPHLSPQAQPTTKMTKITSVSYYRVKPRWLMVKIVDETGQHGWGEATLEGHDLAVEGCLDEMIPRIIGQEAKSGLYNIHSACY